MTLSLYVIRRFLWMLLRVAILFFCLMMLIDSVDQIRGNGTKSIGAGLALHLAALSTPTNLYRILPLVVILSAIALFVGLARSSELVIVRASGRSGLRFLMAPAVAAFAAGLLCVTVFNPLVAATTKRFDDLAAEVARGKKNVMSFSGEGLWMRQGDANGQVVIHADRTNQDATELFGATFLIYDAEGQAIRRIDAERATLGTGAWQMSGAKSWDLGQDNPEITALRQESGVSLPSDLTRQTIWDTFGAPSSISFWYLPGYIDNLEAAGFSARRHRVWFQMELAQPLLWVGMVLLAAGFTMRHARFGKTGRYVLLAVLCGFVIFFLRNFAQVLGDSGQIPVALAAWSPPFVALMLALGLLLHLEDG